VATQTEYTVPAAMSGAAVNNTQTTPHSWMTPEGFYIVEGTSAGAGGTAATYSNVMMGGS
jgi:hypothetical protein